MNRIASVFALEREGLKHPRGIEVPGVLSVPLVVRGLSA